MAFSINDLNYEKDSKERMPWEHYTEEFAKADPAEIAGRLSLPYDEEKKELTLKFLGSVYYISWPDFQVTHEEDDAGFYPLEEMHYAKILAIRFLLNGNVSQGSGRFKTYREMPWGEVYLRQFDGRCINAWLSHTETDLRISRKSWNTSMRFPWIMEILHTRWRSFQDM